MKEFYQLANKFETTKEEWEQNGFKVINFSMVKAEYMKYINNAELAERFHNFNYLADNDSELLKIHEAFEKIVFKESRGGKYSMAIGWENINSYLQWHSGIHYKWFEKKPK